MELSAVSPSPFRHVERGMAGCSHLMCGVMRIVYIAAAITWAVSIGGVIAGSSAFLVPFGISTSILLLASLAVRLARI